MQQVGAAVAATLLVTLAGALAWSTYQQRKLSSIRLDAVDPPLVAEFLDMRGAAVHVETLPMQTSASLPAGDYQLRVSREGTFSQTFDVTLERGQSNIQYKVGLRDSWLFMPQQIDRCFDLVPLQQRQAIIQWTNQGMILRGEQGMAASSGLSFLPAQCDATKSYPGFSWPWLPEVVSEYSGYGSYAYQPWVAKRGVDINGDGVEDVILAARHQAWLMAVSGNGDAVLWFAPRSERLSQTKVAQNRFADRMMCSVVWHEPLVIPDRDADGVPDLIAVMVDLPLSSRESPNPTSFHRWIEAISGRSGKTIWTADLSDAIFELPDGEMVPYAMRWFMDVEGGRVGNSGGAMQFGRHPIRERGRVERSGFYIYRPDRPQVVDVAGQPCLAIVAGRQLLLLDLDTGRPLEDPVALPAPGRRAAWADLDGDRALDLVYLEEVPNPATPREPLPKIHAWSLARRTELWSQHLDVDWPSQIVWTADAPQWPLLADLNADGKAEVLVPLERSALANIYRGGTLARVKETPWCAVAALAGESGTVLWQRKLVSMDAQIDHFIDGPDIDGDGTRELFAATMAGPGVALYVDAVSGATGELLWTAEVPAPGNTAGLQESRVAQLVWWSAGADGRDSYSCEPCMDTVVKASQIGTPSQHATER